MEINTVPYFESESAGSLTMVDAALLLKRYQEAGQEHALACIDKIQDDEERLSSLKQLDEIQVEMLARILDAAKQELSSVRADNIQPFNGPLGRFDDNESTLRLEKIGMDTIRNHKVAALVLAGGQGTRLGFDGPKGMYNIGLPSGRTFFRMISERILKVAALAGASSLPFYIMSSPINHHMTVEYFESNQHFGLGAENVFFFQQGMLPCMTEEGKIIMETASQVSMAPDGNGGVYNALQSSGALANMRARGVEYLHVFSIDNALVKPADPVFLGYCIDEQADCGNKVVWKADPHEKVGVVALQNDKPRIVEYSEMTSDMAVQADANGKLVYGAGNICNHFFTLDFIQEVVLPNMSDLYHIARKKIPYWNGKETVTPASINGIKLETFIFDVFPLSERMAVWEVDRSDEFAPVKNAAGTPSDSPDTAREMISALAKVWLRRARANLVGDETAICEIAPAISYSGEGLKQYEGKAVSCPFSL